MARKPVKVEIVQEGEERFLVKTFADGEETREPVVRLKRKPRYPPRPYWQWDLGKRPKKRT
jgi:hypothetical protein